jgi:hypothetical protein
VSPQDVAYGFAASLEREGNRVRADYLTFLDRTPAQAEVDYWVKQFASGLTNENLVAGFLSSVEYFNQEAKGQSNKVDWLLSAVLDELFETASADQFTTWGTALQ